MPLLVGGIAIAPFELIYMINNKESNIIGYEKGTKGSKHQNEIRVVMEEILLGSWVITRWRDQVTLRKRNQMEGEPREKIYEVICG